MVELATSPVGESWRREQKCRVGVGLGSEEASRRRVWIRKGELAKGVERKGRAGE